MEKICKKYTAKNLENGKRLMELFLWKEVAREHAGRKTIISFERDQYHRQYDEVRLLEEKWQKVKEPSVWPIACLSVVTFALLTALIICVSVFRNVELLVWLLCLGLPALLGLIATFALFLFRASKATKNATLNEQQYRTIINELNALKEDRDD